MDIEALAKSLFVCPRPGVGFGMSAPSSKALKKLSLFAALFLLVSLLAGCQTQLIAINKNLTQFIAKTIFCLIWDLGGFR